MEVVWAEVNGKCPKRGASWPKLGLLREAGMVPMDTGVVPVWPLPPCWALLGPAGPRAPAGTLLGTFLLSSPDTHAPSVTDTRS